LDFDAMDEISSAFSACEQTFRGALDEYRSRSCADVRRELEAGIHNQENLLNQKENALTALNERLDVERRSVDRLVRERDALQERLDTVARDLGQIYASHGWKVLSSYYRIRHALGSLRRIVNEAGAFPFLG
jgi:chromosome segregation ATPase